MALLTICFTWWESDDLARLQSRLSLSSANLSVLLGAGALVQTLGLVALALELAWANAAVRCPSSRS
ncbi:hypothetical protein [Actinospica robiniae]|uniref:hypothetical protein n=1 Tax=Actinospica robiniae TaxID=304901 RepID=UPI00040BFB41|nr:hypothetical protein [Actinospica robiniae]